MSILVSKVFRVQPRGVLIVTMMFFGWYQDCPRKAVCLKHLISWLYCGFIHRLQFLLFCFVYNWETRDTIQIDLQDLHINPQSEPNWLPGVWVIFMVILQKHGVLEVKASSKAVVLIPYLYKEKTFSWMLVSSKSGLFVWICLLGFICLNFVFWVMFLFLFKREFMPTKFLVFVNI